MFLKPIIARNDEENCLHLANIDAQASMIKRLARLLNSTRCMPYFGTASQEPFCGLVAAEQQNASRLRVYVASYLTGCLFSRPSLASLSINALTQQNSDVRIWFRVLDYC